MEAVVSGVDDSVEGEFAAVGGSVWGGGEHAAVVIKRRHVIREVASLQDGNDFLSSPCGSYLKNVYYFMKRN